MSTAKTGTTVQLPKLGESVTEGTIGSWLIKVGDHVERYDPLVEITTDKVNAEVPSPVAGVIVAITAEEGDTLPVGAQICVIDEGNGATSAPSETAPTATTEAATQTESTTTEPTRPAEKSERPTGPDGEIELLRTRSSPAVRRIAEEHGIDISEISGTGISGRVTKSDILKFVEERRKPAAAPKPAEPEAPIAPSPYREPAYADVAATRSSRRAARTGRRGRDLPRRQGRPSHGQAPTDRRAHGSQRADRAARHRMDGSRHDARRAGSPGGQRALCQ